MAFKVNAVSLDRYGDLVARAAGDTQAGREHLVKFGDADDTGGEIYHLAADAHGRAAATTAQVLEELANVSASGSVGLHSAADYYRVTDHGAAARVDASLPGAGCPLGGALADKVDQLQCPPPAFADWREPRDRLAQPEAPGQPGGWGSHPLSALEALSVSGAVMDAVTAVFGFDPIEAIVSQLFGDWEKLAECGVVYDQLAELVDDIAVNIEQGARELDASWDGNAADAAVAYFKRLAESIDGLTTPLHTLGQAHQQAAQASWHAAEAVKGLISTFIDEAVAVSAMMAVGTALIETGVGPLIMYGAATVQIAEMYETYEAMVKGVHYLYDAVMLLVGATEVAITLIEGLPTLDVIAQVYRNPVVPVEPPMLRAAPIGAGS